VKPGDLVRLIPDEDDLFRLDDNIVGLIISDADGKDLLVNPEQNVRFFWLMINGSPHFRMPEDRLELISESG